MGGMGLVAWFGGFVLLVAILIATLRTRSRRFTGREDRARDEATRALYGEEKRPGDGKRRP